MSYIYLKKYIQIWIHLLSPLFHVVPELKMFPPTFVPIFSVTPQLIYSELQPLLTGTQTWQFESSHPLLHMEDSKSMSSVQTQPLVWSLFSLPSQVPTSVFTPRPQSQHFPYGLETTCLHLCSPLVRAHLQERSDQGLFGFISQGWVQNLAQSSTYHLFIKGINTWVNW